MTGACPCGCAVAAWSMPWPVRVAPWSPAVVHEPGATTGAVVPSLFPVDTAGPASDLVAADVVDPDLTATDLITPDLIDTDLVDTVHERRRRAS